MRRFESISTVRVAACLMAWGLAGGLAAAHGAARAQSVDCAAMHEHAKALLMHRDVVAGAPAYTDFVRRCSADPTMNARPFGGASLAQQLHEFAADALLHAGQPTTALWAIDRCIAAGAATSSGCRLAQGRALRQLGRIDDARDALERGLAAADVRDLDIEHLRRTLRAGSAQPDANLELEVLRMEQDGLALLRRWLALERADVLAVIDQRDAARPHPAADQRVATPSRAGFDGHI